MQPNTPLPPAAITFNWLWGYLIPIGLMLLLWGGQPARHTRRITPIAAMSIAFAVLSYWAFGFALHMGGAYAVTQDAALSGLQAMLSLVPGDPGWGVIGLAGFFLSGETLTPTVLHHFLAYLPIIAAAVILVCGALARTRRWIMTITGILTGAVIVPVAACWIWGSGWLSHLGETLDLGKGFVDFGGSALILWLPGIVVLPILLLQRQTQEDPTSPPTNHAPLISNLGALIMGIGWLGWTLSQPFHVSGAVLDWSRVAINVLLGMAGAVVTSQLYGWLVTGKPDTLLAAQGLGAGWGAVLALAPFVPAWGTLIIGALAGLAYPLLHYAITVGLRIRDAATPVALALTSGLLGILSVGVLADGRWGQGWNHVGEMAEGPARGIGVAGVFVSGDAQQLSAQLIGLVALGVWGLLWGGVLGIIASPRLLGSDRYRLRKPHDPQDTEASETTPKTSTGLSDLEIDTPPLSGSGSLDLHTVDAETSTTGEPPGTDPATQAQDQNKAIMDSVEEERQKP